MKLFFAGTGAADWNGPDERGEYRKNASLLLDDRLLIDLSKAVTDSLPDKDAVTDVFFTHSHADHYDPEALFSLAPCRVYAHESWADAIRGDGLEVVPLRIGEPVQAAGFTVIPMPSNHFSDREDETTLHYLIEKEGKRILYATDGAWLTNREHRIIGDKVLDAVIFDATVGDGHPGDWRIFEHNSMDMISLMCATMLKTGRLRSTSPVFLTHLARTLHGTQAELEKKTERPMVVCYDGMEAVI